MRIPNPGRQVAKRESDCSSAHREGDLGPFSPGKMQPLFEAAVVALSVGGISGPVETESGVHIILRTI
jgi:NIMA-interacting peptidyl-prolyl cis-trans isomerase 1